MKKKIRMLAVIIAMMLLYVIRVAYVTEKYKPKKSISNSGEIVETVNASICLDRVELYTPVEFFEQYPECRDLDTYENVMLPSMQSVYMLVCDISARSRNREQGIDYSPYVINMGYEFFAPDLFATNSLTNEKDVSEETMDEGTKKLRLVYCIQKGYLSEEHFRKLEDLELTMQVQIYPELKYIHIGRIRDLSGEGV